MGALVALFLQLLFIGAILYGAYWAVRVGVRHAIADSGMVGLLRSVVEPEAPYAEYEDDSDDESDEESDEDGEESDQPAPGGRR
jgi:hypothetical protein